MKDSTTCRYCTDTVSTVYCSNICTERFTGEGTQQGQYRKMYLQQAEGRDADIAVRKQPIQRGYRHILIHYANERVRLDGQLEERSLWYAWRDMYVSVYHRGLEGTTLYRRKCCRLYSALNICNKSPGSFLFYFSSAGIRERVYCTVL